MTRNYNKLIIEWLIDKFKLNINYVHSFKDSWILACISDGQLSILIDNRVEEQVKLLNLLKLHNIVGIKNTKGELVNKDTIYINLDEEFNINYPKIISKRIISRAKHRSTEKGWYTGEYFYIYTWEVSLDDNTVIEFSNQDKEELDIERYLYPTAIQRRYFKEYINNNYEQIFNK